MRILQLIDTLRPGGAEKMAVNYANAIAECGHTSFLVTTREKGSFVKDLEEKVVYRFLNRKSRYDLRAILKFGRILKQNEIEIVHAHGTSWFFGAICKILYRNHKLIWHNHSGNSKNMSKLTRGFLKLFSRAFNGVISVNNELHNWAKKSLIIRKCICLPNFITEFSRKKVIKNIVNFNIVCVANLRSEKNHSLLLSATDELVKSIKLHVHFIGNDFKDDYSRYIIREFNKREYVTYHGASKDINGLLKNMQLGILVSKYEGMPMVLLEYGVMNLPVISTDVGSCAELLEGNGIIIRSMDSESLISAIKLYYYDYSRAQKDAANFHKFVLENFSPSSVITLYLDFCKRL